MDRSSVRGLTWVGSLEAATLRSPAPDLGTRARRTLTSLLEAAREVFLHHGYESATVDQITELAKVSRASFYTYFPSKRDIFVALAAAGSADRAAVSRRLLDLPRPWNDSDIAQWVSDQIDLMDRHGAFIIMWTQAAQSDPELMGQSLHGYTADARRVGRGLAHLRGVESEDDTLEALVVSGMFDKVYFMWRVAGAAYPREQIERVLTKLMVSIIGDGNESTAEQ